MNEIQSIVEKGVPMPKILVSDRAQIVMSYHILFDQYEEERLEENHLVLPNPALLRFILISLQRLDFRLANCLMKNC